MKFEKKKYFFRGGSRVGLGGGRGLGSGGVGLGGSGWMGTEN